MKLSIITINWNNREGLRETIDSVLSQTARNQLEYIVVDGGAQDGSKEMLEAVYNDNIDKWVSELDSGIYNAMNKGVQMASGDYCLFLNSGDVLHGSNAIADVINDIQGEDLIIGKTVMLGEGSFMTAKEPITLLSLYENSIPHNATFIKRQLLIDHPYDEKFRIVSDWKFFVETIILHTSSYRIIDNVIADFDCTGLSSKNRDWCQEERQIVFKELFPSRVMLDYFQFRKGSGYTDSEYDRFFVKLRDYRLGKLLYSVDVMVVRFIGLFKKNARWARRFPWRLR